MCLIVHEGKVDVSANAGGGGGGERSAGGREGMSEVGREITHTNVQ